MSIDWQNYRSRYDALTLRERVLIFLGVLALLYQLFDMVILGGQVESLLKQQRALAEQQQASTQLLTEINAVTQKLRNNPNKALRQRVERARQQLMGARSQLDEMSAELVAPSDMANLLEQMLLRQGGLQLQLLQTLESRQVNAAKQKNNQGQTEQPVYAHGFAVEFTGGYLQTLEYLEALHALPWRFYWDSVELDVEVHPLSRVRLQLHTLSYSEDWIGV